MIIAIAWTPADSLDPALENRCVAVGGGRLPNRIAADRAALVGFHERDETLSGSGVGSGSTIFCRPPRWERRKFLTGVGGPSGSRR